MIWLSIVGYKCTVMLVQDTPSEPEVEWDWESLGIKANFVAII